MNNMLPSVVHRSTLQQNFSEVSIYYRFMAPLRYHINFICRLAEPILEKKMTQMLLFVCFTVAAGLALPITSTFSISGVDSDENFHSLIIEPLLVTGIRQHITIQITVLRLSPSMN